MAVDVKGALTHKFGPLPAWGWGVALGGGILVWRYVRGGASSGQQAASSGTPTFVNPEPSQLANQQSGFIDALSAQLGTISDRLDQLQSNPSGYLTPVESGAHDPIVTATAPPATTAATSGGSVPIAAITPPPAASAVVAKVVAAVTAPVSTVKATTTTPTASQPSVKQPVVQPTTYPALTSNVQKVVTAVKTTVAKVVAPAPTTAPAPAPAPAPRIAGTKTVGGLLQTTP
jgi:hypothetical protein